MRLWRLCKAKFVENALTGEGAFRYPGRWNMRNVRMIYSATTASLAILEFLAHVDPEDVPSDLRLLELHAPGNIRPIPNDIPVDFRASPAPASTQAYGTAWALGNGSLTLTVPSVLIPVSEERIVLINPLHRTASKMYRISEAPYPMDLRFVRRS